MDESFFTYDSLARRVWIAEGERPVITVTGSHRHSVLHGALSLDGRQLFRQYENFDGASFFDYLKLIHKKFGRCLLFLDKATQHQTEEVLSYFERHERTLVPIWEPTASPEFMPLEEAWHVSKDDLLVLASYSSFEDFRRRIGEYFRTKRFNLGIANYLTAEPR
ncbi:MAG: transposase [Nitrososphaerota archaeon]|nr:transposase [Nitrososphaerota archaeon]MDG7020988.1 transposase [Nitrososphaerota archaeon]